MIRAILLPAAVGGTVMAALGLVAASWGGLTPLLVGALAIGLILAVSRRLVVAMGATAQAIGQMLMV